VRALEQQRRRVVDEAALLRALERAGERLEDVLRLVVQRAEGHGPAARRRVERAEQLHLHLQLAHLAVDRRRVHLERARASARVRASERASARRVR